VACAALAAVVAYLFFSTKVGGEVNIEAVHARVDEIDTLIFRTATLDEIKAGLASIHLVSSWLEAKRLAFTSRLSEVSSFPENDLATAARTGQQAAATVVKRAETVAKMPEFGRSLADGAISAEHVDAVTRGLQRLAPAERPAFASQASRLALLAGNSTAHQFAKAVQRETDAITARDGSDLLTRQKAAARLRTWRDRDTGMWCFKGQLDPETGMLISGKVDATLAAKFAEKVPDGAPSDPGEKQDWLRAQALIALIIGDPATRSSGGRPEAVVVIDSRSGTIRWPFDFHLPGEALRRYCERAAIFIVDLHGNRIHYAPGNLNLGRTQRLANRAQRRALGALYATCAVPGCCVKYENTKPHHVWWWEDGGPTDLYNLLPLCSRHHHCAHEGGWKLSLAEDRSLTIKLPDGRTMTTGPPGHKEAAA
jgi:hypothetical protein